MLAGADVVLHGVVNKRLYQRFVVIVGVNVDRLSEERISELLSLYVLSPLVVLCLNYSFYGLLVDD